MLTTANIYTDEYTSFIIRNVQYIVTTQYRYSLFCIPHNVALRINPTSGYNRQCQFNKNPSYVVIYVKHVNMHAICCEWNITLR